MTLSELDKLRSVYESLLGPDALDSRENFMARLTEASESTLLKLDFALQHAGLSEYLLSESATSDETPSVAELDDAPLRLSQEHLADGENYLRSMLNEFSPPQISGEELKGAGTLADVLEVKVASKETDSCAVTLRVRISTKAAEQLVDLSRIGLFDPKILDRSPLSTARGTHRQKQ